MPTQAQIADHLGISQPAVSGMLDRLEIDWRGASLDDVRLAYLKHLRAIAAGHSAGTSTDLAAERAMTERVTREIKLLELAEKRGQLVNAAELEDGYGRMIDAFRESLLGLAERVAGDIKTLYGVDVDVELINEPVRDALTELSRYAPDDARGADAAGVPDEAAGEIDDDVLGDALSAPVGQELGPTGAL